MCDRKLDLLSILIAVLHFTAFIDASVWKLYCRSAASSWVIVLTLILRL